MRVQHSGSDSGNRGTAYWRELDSAHHLHPFTDTAALNAKGTRVIARGEGIYLWDSDGHRLLDGMSGLWCVNLGYGRRDLMDAAYRQMQELPYYNTFFQTSNIPSTELAAAIAEITPDGLNHVFFANSGSEANDTVVRMVRRYWQIAGAVDKTVIISRENAYHGSTVVGMSLGGMAFMHNQGGPLLPDVAHIPQPYWYADGGDLDADAFGLAMAGKLEEKILELGADRIAAFIGEPIQGAGGVIVPPASYWPEIQRICDKYNILLIADEVICGFGRTGNWFGSQTFGIRPNVIAMAKGLSSGYLPISAVAVDERVARALIECGDEFAHGFTYSGHPVSAAVALQTIRAMQAEKIVENVVANIAPYFQKQLHELADHPMVGDVSGCGLLGGIALMKDKNRKAFFDDPGQVGYLCRDHCFAQGLVMRSVGDRMVLSPPLIITKAEIDELFKLVRKCLDLTWADVAGH